jgi:hypothetical protein
LIVPAYSNSMNASQIRATFGLNCRATPAKSGTTGTVQVGESNQVVNVTEGEVLVAFSAVVVGSGSSLVANTASMNSIGSTSWVAGLAQVEAATLIAAAGATNVVAGTATVTITSGVVAGAASGLVITVPGLTAAAHGTTALLATAIRNAIAANAAVSSKYAVSGSGPSIILTRKPTSTYVVNNVSIPVYPATDATLNIATANGTCTGITAAPTSAGTLVGTATSGAYAPDLDGTDYEGEALPALSANWSFRVKADEDSSNSARLSESNSTIQNFMLAPGAQIQTAGSRASMSWGNLTISPASGGDNSCLVVFEILAGQNV